MDINVRSSLPNAQFGSESVETWLRDIYRRLEDLERRPVAGRVSGSPSSGGVSPSLPFVTIGNTPHLTAERSLLEGSYINITDGGPNTSVSVAVDIDAVDTHADGRYLKLTADNDPLTGALDIKTDSANALRVLTAAGVEVLTVDSLTNTAKINAAAGSAILDVISPNVAGDYSVIHLYDSGSQGWAIAKNPTTRDLWINKDTTYGGYVLTALAIQHTTGHVIVGPVNLPTFTSDVSDILRVKGAQYTAITVDGTTHGQFQLAANGVNQWSIYSQADTVFRWYRQTGGTPGDVMSLTSAGALATIGTVQGTQLISTIATGTSPLSVTSTTLVTNLNADLLDGKHASEFAPASGAVSGTGTQNYLTKWTGASTLGDCLIRDDGTTIALGAAPMSTALFQITTSPTITSGTFNGLNMTYTASPGGASSGVYQGLTFAVGTQSANANNFTQSLRGVVGQAQHNGTGTVNALTVLDVQTQINSSGNVTTAYGIRLTSVAGSTGRANSNYGLYIENTAPFTTINTAIGIAATSGAGSLKYGLSIGAITGGTGANVAIETLGGQLQFTHNANSTLATFTGSGTFTAATPLVLLTRNDSNTSVVVTNLTLRANTTGTAANGFGVKLNYEAESSTTASQTIAYDERLWTDVTHASRTALYRGTTTGNATQSGFYGAWAHNAVSNTAITIIPNGTGDVASVGTFVFTVKDNTSSTTNGGIVVLNPNGGAISLLSDGTDTLQITCAADGSVTIARSAGTHTFSVSLWGTWQ